MFIAQRITWNSFTASITMFRKQVGDTEGEEGRKKGIQEKPNHLNCYLLLILKEGRQALLNV